MEKLCSTPAEPKAGYDKVFADMLALREEYLKLTKEEQDRLLKEAFPVWFPNVDPFKTRLILGSIGKLLK